MDNGGGIIEDDESDLISSIMLRDDSTNAGLLKAYRHFMRRIINKKQEPPSLQIGLENACSDNPCKCYEKCPVCTQILVSGNGNRIVITLDKGVQADFNQLKQTKMNVDLNDVRIPEIVYNTPKKVENRKSEIKSTQKDKRSQSIRKMKSEEIPSQKPTRSLDQLQFEYVKLLILDHWHKFDDDFRKKFANSICTAPLLAKDELKLCQKTFKNYHKEVEQLQRIYLAKIYQKSDRKFATRKFLEYDNTF